MQRKKCYDRFITHTHPTTYKSPHPLVIHNECEPTENYQNYLLR